MEKELFDATIMLCTMIATGTDDYKENPLWIKSEAIIKKYQELNPDCKVDTKYNDVVKWKANKVLAESKVPEIG